PRAALVAARSRAGAVTPLSADRDRDASGRPKNARPRDGLGRPLERGAVGEPVMGDDVQLSPAKAVDLAQRLLDEGPPFPAHEVLEAVWKSAPLDQRELWRGLAQIAVGLTHARRGNSHGAVTLLRRGAAAVAGYLRMADPESGAVPETLNLTGIHAGATELADLIAVRGIGAVTQRALQRRRGPPVAARGWAAAASVAAARGRRGGQVLASRDVATELAAGQRITRSRHRDRCGKYHPVDPAVKSDQRAA